MSSTLNSMQVALVNAGLLTAERAERVNTITKDQKRKAEKMAKQGKVKVPDAKPKPNQNKKEPVQEPLSKVA